ncbi:MAG: ATP-binding protein [Clostridia bacterium]|nr:ATP-binding protein [Clostridia bacterium]
MKAIMTFEVGDIKTMSAQLRAFSRILRESGINEDDIFSCRLVACELLSNVILHGGQTASFESELKPDVIEMTVTADCQKDLQTFHALPEDLMDVHGRGLYIVGVVSDGGIEKSGTTFKVKIRRTSKEITET